MQGDHLSGLCNPLFAIGVPRPPSPDANVWLSRKPGSGSGRFSLRGRYFGRITFIHQVAVEMAILSVDAVVQLVVFALADWVFLGQPKTVAHASFPESVAGRFSRFSMQNLIILRTTVSIPSAVDPSLYC